MTERFGSFLVASALEMNLSRYEVLARRTLQIPAPGRPGRPLQNHSFRTQPRDDRSKIGPLLQTAHQHIKYPRQRRHDQERHQRPCQKIQTGKMRQCRDENGQCTKKQRQIQRNHKKTFFSQFSDLTPES